MSLAGYGVTVAGACNGSTTTNETVLLGPTDVLVTENGTIYVGDLSNRVLAFDLNNRTARTVATFANWPTSLFIDNRTSDMYVSVFQLHLVYILPGNRTIPPDRSMTGNCSLNRLCDPIVVIVDSAGNVYIGSLFCHSVTRWAPNANVSTLIAGSPLGQPGSDSQSLWYPHGLALDEPNSFLYVADHGNQRIQRFLLGGSGIGVTVAGGNGLGTAPNQLNGPTKMYLSKIDGSLYIADYYNSRVQKWMMNNSSSGVTVAGSPSGATGRTVFLMNLVYAISFDANETQLYVSDTFNGRVQRFDLH
jgi:DNA-binding beta-propeller fold protein YncE